MSESATSHLAVMLEVEGDSADALHVVDGLLDAGFFQDAINEHDCDSGPLRVKVAVVRPRQFEQIARDVVHILSNLPRATVQQKRAAVVRCLERIYGVQASELEGA